MVSQKWKINISNCHNTMKFTDWTSNIVPVRMSSNAFERVQQKYPAVWTADWTSRSVLDEDRTLNRSSVRFGKVQVQTKVLNWTAAALAPEQESHQCHVVCGKKDCHHRSKHWTEFQSFLSGRHRRVLRTEWTDFRILHPAGMWTCYWGVVWDRYAILMWDETEKWMDE